MTLQDRIDELVAQHGGLRAAARVLQMDPSYLLRLHSGEKTNPHERHAAPAGPAPSGELRTPQDAQPQVNARRRRSVERTLGVRMHPMQQEPKHGYDAASKWSGALRNLKSV